MTQFIAWFDRHAYYVLAVLLTALLMLHGCGRTQVQDLADARAGAVAWQAENDPARRDQIAAGVMGHLLAALDQYPLLPAPTRTVDEIRIDPGDYAAAGADAQADPQPYDAADHPVQEPLRPGISDTLRSWGDTALAWGMPIGLTGLALALVLWLFNIFGWTWGGWLIRWLAGPILRPIINLAAMWGNALSVVGIATLWLAAWWWAVLLVAILAVGIAAWFNWRDLRTWWRKHYNARKET